MLILHLIRIGNFTRYSVIRLQYYPVKRRSWFVKSRGFAQDLQTIVLTAMLIRSQTFDTAPWPINSLITRSSRSFAEGKPTLRVLPGRTSSLPLSLLLHGKCKFFIRPSLRDLPHAACAAGFAKRHASHVFIGSHASDTSAEGGKLRHRGSDKIV